MLMVVAPWAGSMLLLNQNVSASLRSSLIFHVDIIFYKNWFKSKTKTQTAYVCFASCSHGSCCGLLQGWMEMFLFYSSVISFPLDSWNCWGMGMTQKCTRVHTQRPGSDADDTAAVLIWHRYVDNDIESVHLFTLKDQMRQMKTENLAHFIDNFETRHTLSNVFRGYNSTIWI